MSSRGGAGKVNERRATTRAEGRKVITTPVGQEPPMVGTLRGLVGKRADLSLTAGDTRYGGSHPTVKVKRVYPITLPDTVLAGAGTTHWWMDGELTTGADAGQRIAMRVDNIKAATAAPRRAPARTPEQKAELADRQRVTYEHKTAKGRLAERDRIRVRAAEQRQKAATKATPAATPKAPATPRASAAKAAKGPTLTAAKARAVELDAAVRAADRAINDALNNPRSHGMDAHNAYVALRDAKDALGTYLRELPEAQRAKVQSALDKATATTAATGAPRRSRAKTAKTASSASTSSVQ